MSDKRYGLRLTLGGAPNTPHFLPGIAGYFRPDVPTPVGGDGELPLANARDLDQSNAPLELVELKGKEAQEAEDLTKQTLEDARKHRLTVRKARGAEAERLKDETAAQKEG